MKAASGIAHVAGLLLVACATAQSVDGDGSIAGNVPDAGHRRDSGTMPSGDGGAMDNGGAGGTPTSSGGADQTSTGGATGGAGDSSGGSGGTTHGSSGGTAGTSTGGLSGATGGTTASGGSAQGGGGMCAANQKACAGACVTQVPSNGCSATSCTACPIPAPANGLQVCDMQGQCNFECLSGYFKNGALCTMGVGGAGGGGGGGSSGSGGEPTMCGNDNCHRCLGNLIGCCNKQGDRCMCVFPNQTDQCGP